MSANERPRTFSFPNPVNEVAARVVAGGVLVLAVVTLVTHWWWLLVPLTYGFLARVATGPTLSPLGQLATRVVAPRVAAPRLVPGPPKRFAQAIGAAVTISACVLHFGFGADGAAAVLLGLMVFFAALESIIGVCVGCRIFAGLMRIGVIPEEVCAACNNLGLRLGV